MNSPSENRNDTISLNYINTIMSLISLMSAHFLVNSFTLLSDMETQSAVTFTKIASKYYLQINCKKSVKNIGKESFIVLGKPDYDFFKMFQKKPRLVVAVGTMNEEDSTGSQLLTTSTIPPSTSFFTILLANETTGVHNVTGKCFQLYKPISDLPLKAFPRMLHTRQDWIWESKHINWNSIKEESRNMSGVSISIAMVSHFDKEKVSKLFWSGRQSFFWKRLEDQLKFRPEIMYRKIELENSKRISKIYASMLMKSADGLGALPVITAERGKFLDFVPTGLDTRYHLLVRYPRYVYSWRSIFKPLAVDSWISLAVGILLISITLKIVTQQQNPPTDWSSCFLSIFGFVCSQGSSNIPTNNSARLVIYITLLFSLIIYQYYTSNFYSLLSTKEVSLPFTSLEEFIAKRTHALYVLPDTGIYDYIVVSQRFSMPHRLRNAVKAENGTFKKLWDEVLKHDPSHQLKLHTRPKALGKVCKGQGAILGMTFQTLLMRELTCQLVPVNSGYFPANIATVLRRKFPFLSQFKFVHLRVLEVGLTHKYRDTELDLKAPHTAKEDVINEPVSLEHVAFLFAFLFSFILVSWLILSVEIITSKSVKSKIMKKRG